MPSTKAGNSGDCAILALRRTTSSAIPAARAAVSSLLASNSSFSHSNSRAAFLSPASRSPLLSFAFHSALFSSIAASRSACSFLFPPLLRAFCAILPSGICSWSSHLSPKPPLASLIPQKLLKQTSP